MIDGNGINSPSTKLAASAIQEFNIKRSFTLVYSDEDEDFETIPLKKRVMKQI